MQPYSLKAASDAQLGDIYIFLQPRPQAAPSKGIPLPNHIGRAIQSSVAFTTAILKPQLDYGHH